MSTGERFITLDLRPTRHDTDFRTLLTRCKAYTQRTRLGVTRMMEGELMLICFCESPERKEADRKEVSKQQEEDGGICE